MWSTASSRDPAWDRDVIRDELEAHDPALLEKPLLVVFNKLDLPAAAGPRGPRSATRSSTERPAGRRRCRRRAARGSTALRAAPRRPAPATPTSWARPPEPAGVVVHRIEACGDDFVVDREDGAFRVRGKRIERIAAQTNFEVEESAERFQRDLAKLGIDDELRRAGIEPGDLVRIGATELEWEAQPWEEQ